MIIQEVSYSCAVGISDSNLKHKKERWSVPEKYTAIKDLIFAKLINTKRNKELLEQLPHEQILDLSLVFYFFRNDDPDDEEILVTETMLDLWKVGYFQLFEDAMQNTRNIMGEMIRPLKELIGDMLKELNPSLAPEEDGEAMPMYVLTNLWKKNGAVCMMFREGISELAKMLDSDLYIIPSSIHEVILIPASEDIARDALDRMIQEVNASELDADDVLSDHAYYFSKNQERLGM